MTLGHKTTREQELPDLVEWWETFPQTTSLMKLHKTLKTIMIFMIDDGSMNKKN